MDNRREEDFTLVKMVQNGDPSSFKRLYERYFNYAVTIARRQGNDREDASDIAQDALIKAYKAISGFDYKSAFKTWLTCIVLNTGIDHHRKKQLRRTIELYDNISVDRDNPEKSVLERELGDAIGCAIEELPPEQRKVFTRYSMDGIPYATIAKEMKIPEGTVMSRLFYARQKIRNSIKAYYQEG